MNFTINTGFLDALANPAPTPGGGSAAAYAGAMAAALVVMVAQTTLGKPKYASVHARMQQIIDEAAGCRAALEQAVSRDAAAFESLLAAYRASKTTPNPQLMAQAALHVTQVPMDTARTALRVLEWAVEAAETANMNAMSDACAAAGLANSTVFASTLNVRVNAKSLAAALAQDFRAQAGAVEARAQTCMIRLQAIIRERGGIDANG